MLDDLYRDTILEHSQHPRNKRALADATAHARGYNPLCGDDVTVYVKLDGNRIGEVTFTGTACSICEASASMLTEATQGQSAAEAVAMAGEVKAMLRAGPTAPAREDGALGELEALQGVRRFPVRVKCATLSWNALEQALAQAGVHAGG